VNMSRDWPLRCGPELYRELREEVRRLQLLCIELIKNEGRGHILETATHPPREEYEAALARDIYLGPTLTYTCLVHNLDMTEHGRRCPECDSTAHQTDAP
jgi:hypothetical protein